ncbi:hypothetical protein [Streptomyces sp. NPDC012888]|uniref:hypothetical protein n=1 Tax=Streptomyces sp. NPDC012888 TaxID=3364855 RepID=UPI0036CD3AD3
MSETDRERPADGTAGAAGAPGPSGDGGFSPTGTLELLAHLVAGVADLAIEQLKQSSDRAHDVMRRADLRELLTDGVVELRKRGELATQRMGGGSDNYLEAMAQRAARKAGPRA